MYSIRKILIYWVILALVLVVFAPLTLGNMAWMLRTHPSVVDLAQEKPFETVRVIVQKADRSNGAEALVTALGGAIERELHIINAFVAELPAAAAVELAKSSAVRWVSLDAGVTGSGRPTPPTPSQQAGAAVNYYPVTLGVRAAWNQGLRGSDIGVAVIDSGIANHQDLTIKKNMSFNPDAQSPSDQYGHGTHVSGIIGGNGTLSRGVYTGIAPDVVLFNLKISDDMGMAYESDVVAAIQWVLENAKSYNIRVVNLSTNSTTPQSYHNSPLDAAAEILWFNGIVVVASAGNTSPASDINFIDTAPANDPFIITVGASNENSTPNRADDTIATFSASGFTMDGFRKPDIIAPGTNIISCLAGYSDWDSLYPERKIGRGYFRLSGTSMAAPMVTGAVALLLQDEPGLTPDQVKYRLVSTGSTLPGEFPYLDIYAAITGTTDTPANTGTAASQLLWTGPDPLTWNSVSWNSVSWNSVSWNSVSWNSVSWNSVSWNK